MSRLNDKLLVTLNTETPCTAPLPPHPCEFVEPPEFNGLIMMTNDSQPLAPAMNTNTAEVLCSDLALGGANTSSTSPTVSANSNSNPLLLNVLKWMPFHLQLQSHLSLLPLWAPRSLTL